MAATSKAADAVWPGPSSAAAPSPPAWDVREWVALEQMAEGFDEFCPPVSAGLEGHSQELEFSRGDGDWAPGGVEFGGGELRLSAPGALPGAGRQAAGPARVYEMAPDLFFVHATIAEREILSFAYDAASGVLVGAFGVLGIEPNPTHVKQFWLHGRRPGGPAAARTDEMVGRRIRYRYSSDDVYDHIYLSADRYTWFCVSGAEAGEGDTDKCQMWRLRDGIVLFSWLEKILGVEGMVLVNFNTLRSVGLQFAVDQFSGAVVNLAMGAHALPVSTTPPLARADPRPPA
ncbi:MAG: molybdenum cofactor biosynthesis F family protein [Bifidobacteriaceae bacterium]|nr:molybdenum cofactor biosynthesis F family protein [Bifidobacteriaceae bacterium]